MDKLKADQCWKIHNYVKMILLSWPPLPNTMNARYPIKF